jgi:3-oxoacyl-[acyl-carrier-protein] synthase II
VVTGMGFCLPGDCSPVFTPAQLWSVASRGQSCLRRDDVYYGSVGLSRDEFDDRVPDVAGRFSRHFTDAHRFGLLSMTLACEDAGLDFRAGDLGEAAVLVGRGGVDANVHNYLAILDADPKTTAPDEAMALFIRGQQGITPSDVALVQSALLRSSGPCFTVSCGRASSAVQIGNALRMIACGETDLAVVTGVDLFSVDVIQNIQNLLRSVQSMYSVVRMDGMPKLLPSFDQLMRPYDRRAACVNHGEGSATLILESREHADRRGAADYGLVLGHGMTRDGLANPLASDASGASLAAAVQISLAAHCTLEQIPYIHGGSDGDVVVTAFESNAVRTLYGGAAADVLVTSQEACFGHNGAPAGCVGVAVTLLMMRHRTVCPTANCEEPADNLSFDPVPGTCGRPLDFRYALSWNYQIGGVKSALLLGASDTA